MDSNRPEPKKNLIKNLTLESTTNSKHSILPKYLVDLCKINYCRSLKLPLYVSRFSCVHVLSEAYDEDWSGETGRISTDLINLHFPHLSQAKILICGPKGFNSAAQK